MQRVSIALLLAALILCPAAIADDITIDGKQYTEVYVREGGSLYYVQVPDDGKVLTVQKTQVSPADLTISEDAAYRSSLKARWQTARGTEKTAWRPLAERMTAYAAQSDAAPAKSRNRASLSCSASTACWR